MTSSLLKGAARRAGFDLCGIARADRYPRLTRLAEWIDRGLAGDMRYLDASRDERLDPSRVLPTVRSIVSVACLYNTPRPYSTAIAEPDRAAVSRYAWGDDYHDVLRRRLRELVGWMADEAGAGFEALSLVDSGPVQERVFAEQAGLGWIGKNTCLINPVLGSWIFLAEILTNAELEPDRPGVDQCGTCRRCIDACPTGAIVEPYVLDATRCLSYLTIESRGAVAEPLRPAVGSRVYGCDICQDVCPWNRRAPESDDPAWQPREGLAFPRLIDLCRMSDDAWRGSLRGSAMRRAGLGRIRRSLAYAAIHLPPPDARAALDALAAHPSSHDTFVKEGIDWARADLDALTPGRPTPAGSSGSDRRSGPA
jgi:epoxyqueuosine reductase